MSDVEAVATEKAPSTRPTKGAADSNGGPATNHDETDVERVAILDRSRAALRLPTDLLVESLKIAHVERQKKKFDRLPKGDSEELDSASIERLERAGVFHEGMLDPIAFELLDVVNTASLTITVDLRFGPQASAPGIWATPKLAVVSSSIDPHYVEFSGSEVGQLTQLLAQHVVLRSPQFIGQAPISVNINSLIEAEAKRHLPKEALEILGEAGLDDEQAQRVLIFQGDLVRRWRITSRWSTDEGQQGAELRGLDAGPDGQWLLGLTGSRNKNGQMTFTPQGHGDMMKALRSILPRNWVGTPLSKPPQ